MSDPQSKLPEEAWNLIFNCLEDPQDVLSSSQTCTLFQGVLSPTRTTWAFPSVFSPIFEFLSKNYVLQCRLVSKSWLKVVDKFLQADQFAPILVQQLRNHGDVMGNYFLTRISKHESPILNLDRGIQNWHINQNGALIGENMDDILVEQDEDLDPVAPVFHHQPDEFMQIFGDNYEKNPFPSRAVVLTITDSNTENPFQFLNQFGVYIWSLGLIIQLNLTSRQMIQLLWKLLNRVPNLKHLFIKTDERHVHVIQLNVQNNLNAFVQASTTPELKLLKWIELRITDLNIHDVIVEAFSGRSVTIFGFPGGIRPCNISANGWKQLDMEVGAGVSTWQWDMLMVSFKHLHLPLESINLQFSKCKDLELIFVNLSKYGPTLRRLTLTFNNLRNREFVKMRQQVDAIYTTFLSQMTCLVSFEMVVHCDKSTTEFCEFVDEILSADWIEKYLEMGGVLNGFRRHGFASISAGLKMTAEG